MKRSSLTPTVAMHYGKLVLRGLLFLAALGAYLHHALTGTGSAFGGLEKNPVLTGIIWLFFMTGMLLRFFPGRLESMGCQKQFAKNYRPTGHREPKLQKGVVTFAVFSAWVALNASIGLLYYAGFLNRSLLLLIALAYSVCDIVCILFFCPFQTWIQKNRCCTTCRIYNWDYAMMFTPLVFVPHFYTWSLLGVALALVVQWEYKLHRHPERFSPCTNGALSCQSCTEKLCRNKRQLRRFLKKYKFDRSGIALMKK